VSEGRVEALDDDDGATTRITEEANKPEDEEFPAIEGSTRSRCCLVL